MQIIRVLKKNLIKIQNHVLIPTGSLQSLLYLYFFQISFGGKTAQKATKNEIKQMIASRDIEKIVVVNKGSG